MDVVWNGTPITENGTYVGIPLAEYHGNVDLFDAPSISKSALKWLLPSHGGSPKAFWGRWAHNPAHIEGKRSDALDFGKAVHCLLLGDEVFSETFIIRPEEFTDYKKKAAQEWREEMQKAGMTIVTPEQLLQINRIAEDAGRYPLVQQGLLNGAVERTMAWKDPETGLWLRCRPDVLAADGIFADLKTAAKFDEDFLEKQAFDAAYYLQGAMTRMVCRALDIPFETFVLLYVLTDEVPDTAHVEVSEHELDRGEGEIRWALRTIRQCLDSGEWPGARPFAGGERHLQLKPWTKERIDNFLEMENAA
ncbi:PD-(D/E)XK nuclease-like domain-containing protein [Aureimonas psammosilenae]|uniref:PD-(D/E)XK nuclease-like domain-containing protein n=1 Tax=Aureimonas psammosilenae TaxID=2495496 RepID=UPI001AEE7B80|nr:PD-(D/E)XK nuclease-like domain-containing protein [Aureimonas psammosilenae]